MKQFFNEYGGVAVLVIVIAVLLLIVGSVKALDESAGKVKGSGVAGLIGNKLSESLSKFQESFNNVASGGSNGGTDNSENDKKILVSKSESQVGKYADIDGDGTVDGIIFADLLVDKKSSGVWNSNITLPTIDSAKSYYVSQKLFADKLGGTAEVLSPTSDEGDSRFYIVALSDIDAYTHYWYKNAIGKMDDYTTATNHDFGTGKTNTSTMIEKWNKGETEGGYGAQDSNDIWNLIQTHVKNGWFIPSRLEWAAFSNNLEISSSNYFEKGLSDCVWTSTQNSSSYAYTASFYRSKIGSNTVNYAYSVRLATTF